MYAVIHRDAVMFECLLEHGAVIPSAGDAHTTRDTLVTRVMKFIRRHPRSGHHDQNTKDDLYNPMNAMIAYREAWITQAIHLIRRMHLPMTAIRVIHEYVFKYNWPSTYGQIQEKMK